MAEMTEKQWLSGVQSSIIKELTTHKAALPAGFNQERFALNTVTVISEMLKDKKKKTELCKLTFESMAVCLCKAAYLGLDYFNGECYAIPYGGELNFQTDYKGEIKMCKRFSRNPIKDIFAKVVRQDDFFTEEVDAGVQNVIYRPQPFSNKPMIGAFAIVVFKDGSMMYDTMSVEEIENVRNTYSKAKDSQAWKSSTGEMYKKTVLRRLCKLIDLDFDNIEQQKAYLAGGDVEFENGQPVFIDGRTATAALPDNGAPVDVFAQMEQAKKEPVLLYGPVGTGKSYAAACIANELLNQKIPVIMTSFVKILQMIQDKQVEESELIARLNNAKLLIIDDLGTERNTDYGLEKVYNVIDSRYLAGKPLILTTNLMLTDMKENMDTRYKRIYDRIFAMCFPHRVAGASWRMNQAADRYDEMRKRLLKD